VENKGLSLSIHTRHVRTGDMARVQDGLLRAMRYQIPYLLIATGIHVLEVRPRVGWDKGKAAALLRQRIGPAAVLTVSVGDDQTDEDLFRATPDGITVKVGSVGNSVAAYALASSDEVQEFLHWLAALPADKSLSGHEPSLSPQEA
jgi:trehalose 6-phosphate phosphatase